MTTWRALIAQQVYAEAVADLGDQPLIDGNLLEHLYARMPLRPKIEIAPCLGTVGA